MGRTGSRSSSVDKNIHIESIKSAASMISVGSAANVNAVESQRDEIETTLLNTAENGITLGEERDMPEGSSAKATTPDDRNESINNTKKKQEPANINVHRSQSDLSACTEYKANDEEETPRMKSNSKESATHNIKAKPSSSSDPFGIMSMFTFAMGGLSNASTDEAISSPSMSDLEINGSDSTSFMSNLKSEVLPRHRSLPPDSSSPTSNDAISRAMINAKLEYQKAQLELKRIELENKLVDEQIRYIDEIKRNYEVDEDDEDDVSCQTGFASYETGFYSSATGATAESEDTIVQFVSSLLGRNKKKGYSKGSLKQKEPSIIIHPKGREPSESLPDIEEEEERPADYVPW